MRLSRGLIAAMWVGSVLSALGVVWSTYQARVATDRLETLRHEAADLHVQAGQLLLERSTLAAYVRIEEIALKKLDMTVPDLDTVVVIKP